MGLHHASSWKFSVLSGLLPHCLPTMPPKQPHRSTALLGHLPAKNFNSFLVTYWGKKMPKLLRMASQISKLNHSRPVFQHWCPSTISWVVTIRPVSSKTVVMLSVFAISQHIPFHSTGCFTLFLHLCHPAHSSTSEYATILREPSSLTLQEREVLVYVFETSVVLKRQLSYR